MIKKNILNKQFSLIDKQLMHRNNFCVTSTKNFYKKAKVSKLITLTPEYHKNLLSQSIFVEKFINFLMIDGKKIKACTIFYKSLNLIKKSFQNPKLLKSSNILLACNHIKENSTLKIVTQAVDNVKANLEVRKVRIAGMTYQVPSLIEKKRQETLAIRWIVESAKNRKLNSKLTFSECLSIELLEAYKKQGQAREKRNELHKIAEANRAYIRYRWW